MRVLRVARLLRTAGGRVTIAALLAAAENWLDYRKLESVRRRRFLIPERRVVLRRGAEIGQPSSPPPHPRKFVSFIRARRSGLIVNLDPRDRPMSRG